MDISRSIAEAGGLSEKEADIYAALLSLGEAPVIAIAKKAGIKRTTVYNILPGMVTAGLVQTTIRKKHRLFFVENVASLKSRLEDRERKIDSLLPELRSLHNVFPFKPKITIYEGDGGMRELYMDTLNSSKPGDTICAFTGMNDFYDLFPKDFSDRYIEERVKRKIAINMIAPESPAAVEWLGSAPQTLRQIKLIKQSLSFKADMEIYADKVALISYRENFIAVIIESKEIHDMQLAAFQLMWKALS
jgi:sugar-specific transcriptional regulator TrmB